VGKVSEHFVDIEGSGNVFTVDLCSDDCTIKSQGNGNCQVKVNNNLSISLEGNGNICYRGQPVVTSDIAGNGNITVCN